MASGESARHSGLSIHAEARNAAPAATAAAVTWAGVSSPAGRCRPRVRGFRASNQRSASRFTDMASVRPLTMASVTQPTMRTSGQPSAASTMAT